MKAVPLTAIGEFTFDDSFPDPVACPGHSLIEVKTVGLNRLDLLVADGEITVPLPHLCGADVVGAVVSSGSPSLVPGQLVLINPAYPPAGEGWPPNRQVPYVRILGAHLDGGFAEHLLVPDEQIYAVPAGLSAVDAATIPLDYLTAWRMLVTKAQVRPNDRVLVWGASGPLGCAALRICQSIGAEAVAIGSRPEEFEVLRAVGASSYVDYAQPDFEIALKDSARDGFDVVFESVGASSWPHTIEAVAQSGRVVICGVTSGASAATDLEELYYKQVTVMGSRMGYPAEFEAMLAEIEAGRLRPGPVTASLSLRDISSALEHLRHRTAPGKIVLTNDL